MNLKEEIQLESIELIRKEIIWIRVQLSQNKLSGTYKVVMEERLEACIVERDLRQGKRKRKSRPVYPAIYYDETLRSEILKGQDSKCLLTSDDPCESPLNLHHIDFKKYNNHKDNLVFLCHEHHFGLHRGDYTLPIK